MFLILFLVPDPLHNGDWILWDLSLKQQGTRNGFWLALIISPNGLKLSLWQTSGMWMLRDLCGGILSLDLGFLTPSSRTIGFSFITRLSGDTVATWALRTDIQLLLIPREIGRLRL